MKYVVVKGSKKAGDLKVGDRIVIQTALKRADGTPHSVRVASIRRNKPSEVEIGYVYPGSRDTSEEYVRVSANKVFELGVA